MHSLIPAVNADPNLTGPNLTGLLLLIIDDDPDTRELNRFVFETQGASVRTASSLREGQVILATEQPQVCLCDFWLPDGDVLPLLKELKGATDHQAASGGAIEGKSQPTSVVVLTGYTRLHTVDEVMAAGADAYLLKPVDPDELLATVARLFTS